jgi:hypothetical protein
MWDFFVCQVFVDITLMRMEITLVRVKISRMSVKISGIAAS